MATNKKVTIKKHSAMIQISVKELTLIQRKLINSLIYVAQKSGISNVYTTSLNLLKEYCCTMSENNTYIKSQLKELKDINFVFNYLNKDKEEVWKTFDLLSEVVIYPKTGIVEFAFPPSLMEKVINPQMYTPIDIFMVASLKISYSIIIYELLRDYLTAPAIPRLSIEELRNLLGIKPHEYKFFPNFKAKVLDAAINEINMKSDLSCKYELIKEFRNKYSHIQFSVFKKQETSTTLREFDENNLSLFEEIVGEEAIAIPSEILKLIPESQITRHVIELLTKHLDKGADFIASNVKYILKKSPENFSAYLKQALENDYASHDREVEANLKKANEKKRRQIEQVETAKNNAQVEYMKALDTIKRLSKDEVERLETVFHEIVKTRGIKPEFLINSVKESLMIEAYQALYKADAYNAKDQD